MDVALAETKRATSPAATRRWSGAATSPTCQAPHAHAVQFYDDDGYLATTVSEYLRAGVVAHEPVIVIATAAHREAFLGRLHADGIDTGVAREGGRFVLLDARQTLESFMVDNAPDAEHFHRVIGGVLDGCVARCPGAPVRAYGEMVDVLWKDGNADGAIQLETMWNELATRHRFSLLCAYSMGNFARAADATRFAEVCAQHTHVTPTEQYVELDPDARLFEISRLEQRARALEVEIAEREILERRLRESLATLQRREEELRDVLENAAEGIHLVSGEGIILWANDAELGLLGYDADEYIGRHITEFHVDQPVITDLLGRLACGESVDGYRARLRHKDGTIRHVAITSNVRWADGKFLHTRCFTRDVTALHQASEERERALERERIAREEAERASAEAARARVIAEQANRAKSDFLAVMSHELRTPLNAIGGYAELMELGIHGPITPQQREALERIQRSQRLLLGLVNQVLNYARIETGNVRYVLANVALDGVLRSVEGLIAPQISTKGLRYAYEGCDPSVVVHADVEKLQQIVLNLLTNAVKFTERTGLVELQVEPAETVVRIHVADTGVGIDASKLDLIFEPFVQVDPNYTRTHDGVGLGLAISQDLARGMGGELTAASTEGVGSVFTLTLPRASAPGSVGER